MRELYRDSQPQRPACATMAIPVRQSSDDNKKWIAWSGFIAVNLTSVYIAYFSELFLLQRHILLRGLAIASLLLGIWAALSIRDRSRAVLATLAVLAIGQLWWIEQAATLLLWSTRGFAP